MSGYISQETVDRILQQADIVQVISEYVPLTRAGRNYRALCPFHEEKTPSFIVSPEKQIFHCFGCGAGGNVFNFLMKWENVSFPEAVRILAQKLGISISSEKDTQFKEDFYRINSQVAEFFHQSLKRNKVAQDYLYKRGLKPSTIDLFKLGWAPSSGIFLDFCKRKNLPQDKLEELGLLRKSSQTGSYYSYFRERIVFPIFSVSGKIIAFGARVLDNSLPKYINSPQSPVFDKGKNLYGLNLAREGIRERDEVILVEGYTDVITLYQEGINNSVASLGTSLTPFQARVLKRYTDKVFIAYDEDSAGRAATIRGIDLLLENDMQVKIISLPKGEDPAEFVRKEGKEAFLERKDKALPYIDYRIKVATDNGKPLNIEKKLEIVNSLFFNLVKIKTRYILDEQLRKISQAFNFSEESLRAEFSRFRREKNKFSFSPILNFKVPEEEDIEKKLLQVMLCSKEALEVVKVHLSPDDFTHPLCRKLAQEIFSYSGNIAPSNLINRITDSTLCSMVSSLSFTDSSLEGVDLQEVALGIIKVLKRRRHQRKIEQLTRMIKDYEQHGEEGKMREIYQQIIQLRKSILL